MHPQEPRVHGNGACPRELIETPYMISPGCPRGRYFSRKADVGRVSPRSPNHIGCPIGGGNFASSLWSFRWPFGNLTSSTKSFNPSVSRGVLCHGSPCRWLGPPCSGLARWGRPTFGSYHLRQHPPRCTRVPGHSHPGRVSADSLSQARHLGCCLAAQGDLAGCQAKDAAMRANHRLPGPDGQQGPIGAA